MTKVKICGIKHLEHALQAADAGADMIGFVFAKSKRQITMELAKFISEKLPSHIEKVGVFVNASIEELEHTAKYVGLDYVQLHGDETYNFCRQLSIPYIKAFKVNNELDLNVTQIYNNAKYILLDSGTGPYYGGNGTTFNWKIVEGHPIDRTRLILAGGLNENNVKEAIKIVQPAIVDVSSGVETNGEKDVNKIKSFIKAVKECGL